MVEAVKDEWEILKSSRADYNALALPTVSVIIPALNCAHAIALTIDSLLAQNYPELEILVVDGGSTDHTLKVVRNYHHPAIRIHSVKSNHPYEMINRGVSLANGTYLNFLFPGDFYLTKDALMWMMNLALDHNRPHMVFSASILHFKNLEPKVLFRDFTLKNIRQGIRPTIIQACWFRSDVFDEIEKFDTDYKVRAGFDLHCRFIQNGSFTYASTSRVVTHFDMRSKSTGYLFRNFWETMRILTHRFSIITTFRWWIHQREFFQLISFWLRNLRFSMIGR